MLQKDHISELDGIRGMAAALVVMAHLDRIGLGLSSPSLSGALGVTLFFNLSGFLMAWLYWNKPVDMPSVVHYIAARAGRIVPLYWLVVISSFALSRVLGPKFVYHFTPYEFGRHMLFAGSKPPFWSIPPEIQFYGVFLLVWCLHATRRLACWWPVVALVVAVLILLRSASPGIVVVSVLHIFLLGVTAGVARRRVSPNEVARTAAAAVQVAALVALALAVAQRVPTLPQLDAIGWNHDRTVYNNIGLALVVTVCLIAFTIETRFARLLFANSVMRRLGSYSFSIYLLHEPVMLTASATTAGLGWPVEARLVADLLAVIAVAAVSFAFVEMPMQRLVRSAVVRLLARWLL